MRGNIFGARARDNRCAKVEGVIIIKPFGDSRARERERERERERKGVAITSEKLIPPRIQLSDDAERPSHIDPPTIRASRVRVQTPLAAFVTSCLPNSCKYVWIVREG